MGPLKPGTLINGRFVIEALSASGGMGTVYRAHDRTTGSAVALKVLERTRSSEARRMHGEAELLKQLDDPGIVSYIGHGSTEQGQFYLVMEWLSGGPLSELLRRGPLSIENALSVGLCAAQALGAAHARSIIHRDVKPSNLMVVDSEPVRVKLVDFGIARPVDLSTFRKTTVGTPGYLAPEQARGGRRYDGRADVFSLGCVLFECLAGQPAFVADDVLALMAKIALEDPPPLAELRPEVPAAFSELLKRMLCKEPQDRPADGNAVLAELKRLSSVIRTGGRKSTPSPFELTTTTLTHHEQRVVSILLAAEAEQTLVGVGEAEVPDSLQSALSPFGAELRRLAGGALACVFSGALASDLAARAARSSLLVASLRPRAPVVVATGRAVTGGRLPVGEVIIGLRPCSTLRARAHTSRAACGWMSKPRGSCRPASR